MRIIMYNIAINKAVDSMKADDVVVLYKNKEDKVFGKRIHIKKRSVSRRVDALASILKRTIKQEI